ncbi:hypothetical protein UY3_08405 [Chelonia mydas]|uniref:Uncharacterized protein n=1 Tax=Chelonia mydas TaxID=8469 RepID=M7BFQ1_CHEMY|nr:hypothetical protein UY3_08405 [Chelonia mydas]
MLQSSCSTVVLQYRHHLYQLKGYFYQAMSTLRKYLDVTEVNFWEQIVQSRVHAFKLSTLIQLCASTVPWQALTFQAVHCGKLSHCSCSPHCPLEFWAEFPMPDGAKNLSRVVMGKCHQSTLPPSVKATADNHFVPFSLDCPSRCHSTASMEPVQLATAVMTIANTLRIIVQFMQNIS